ncbi:hypothetical protein ACFL2V_09230 [Pseudomonadota bacterium]
MKWTVLMLALLNAGYLAWQFYGAQLVSPQTVSSSNETKRLLLMVESDKGQEVSARPETGQMGAKSVGEIKSSGDGALASSSNPSQKNASAIQIGKALDAKACFSVGPFLLVSDVSHAARMFENAGVNAQQRATPEREHAGFWVFIPPMPSMQDARAVLRDLQIKELRDALIISEGDKANAISAGVYYVEKQAEQRRDKIKQLGYEAKIEGLMRTRSQYWLDIELKSATRIPKKLWQQASNKYSGIEKKKRECE